MVGRQTYRSGWLLWLAVAAVSCLPPLGFTAFGSLGVAALLTGVWVLLNISPKLLFNSSAFLALEVFFREIVARNQFKVRARTVPHGPSRTGRPAPVLPRPTQPCAPAAAPQVPAEGTPTLFVCAPHSNQFLDPFVVMYGVGRVDLSYLAAAATVRKRIIGGLARLMESIPVERPQDLAFTGAGTVWLSPEDRLTVLGRGTSFREQVRPGDFVSFGGVSSAVARVTSDESLVLKDAVGAPASGADGADYWGKYKVTPRVDQAAMFNAVTDALERGKAIGIFPEGGSHDQPSLLPLKAGVAIMALTTLSKHPSLPLKIVPVGLNYFSGHRFRSRVFIDIGDPLTVPDEIQELYASDKQAATAQLMGLVTGALSALTVAAPDYETLEFFWTLRRLVKTSATEDRATLTLPQQVEFARRFSVGYERVLPDGTKWKDTVPVVRARRMVAEYNARLKDFGLRDYQVARVFVYVTRRGALALLLWRSLLVVVYAVALLPMALLCFPITCITRLVSRQKASAAAKASAVKIHGRDVAATWKVLIALVLAPVLWLAWTAASAAVAGATLQRPWRVETPLLVFFFLPIVSYLGILAGERIVMTVRSVPPLLMTLAVPSRAKELAEQRQALKQALEGLVDESGWRVEDYIAPLGRPLSREGEMSAQSRLELEELEGIDSAVSPRASSKTRGFAARPKEEDEEGLAPPRATSAPPPGPAPR